MNVPLKKRYSYSAINNIVASSGTLPSNTRLPKVNTVTAVTNALYQIRENNNDNKVDRTHCIDIDKLPDKTETLSSATMPASVLNNQGEELPQNNSCVDDVLNANHQDDKQKNAPPFTVNSEAILPEKLGESGGDGGDAGGGCAADGGRGDAIGGGENVIGGNGDQLNVNPHSSNAISLKTSTSSAAANTSSSSIKSGAKTDQNGNSSQCGDGGSQIRNSKAFVPRRESIILRHSNKHLNETNVKISELENPAMTTRDRVMNWMIADEFSDPEDDIDLDDTKFLSAFRSERLQIKSYQKNRPQPIKSKSRSKTISSNRSTATAAKKAKSVIYKPFKLFFTEKIFKTPSVSASNSSDPIAAEVRNVSKKKRAYPDDGSKSAFNVPKKRSLLRQLSHDGIRIDNPLSASAKIKLRIDYPKKSGEVVGGFKIPEAPVARTVSNYELDRRGMLMRAAAKFRAGEFDGLSELNSRASPLSLNDSVANTAASNQEEFYKYLGIDINRCHGKQSPESCAADSLLSSNRRRSLRVKIQQKVVRNNANKTNAAKDDTNKNRLSKKSQRKHDGMDDSASSSVSNGGYQYNDSYMGNSSMEQINQSASTNDSYLCPRLGLDGDEDEPTAPVLIRYSYQKQANTKRPVTDRLQDKTNKSLLMPTIKTETNANNTPNMDNQNNQIGGIKSESSEPANVCSSAIVDRRFYEPIDSESSTYPFLNPDAVAAAAAANCETVDDKTGILNSISKLANADSSLLPTIDLTCVSDIDDDDVEILSNHNENVIDMINDNNSNCSYQSDIVEPETQPQHTQSQAPRSQYHSYDNDCDMDDKKFTLAAMDAVQLSIQNNGSTNSNSRGTQPESNDNQGALAKRKKSIARKKSSLNELFKRYEKSLQKSLQLLHKKDRGKRVRKRNVLREPAKIPSEDNADKDNSSNAVVNTNETVDNATPSTSEQLVNNERNEPEPPVSQVHFVPNEPAKLEPEPLVVRPPEPQLSQISQIVAQTSQVPQTSSVSHISAALQTSSVLHEPQALQTSSVSHVPQVLHELHESQIMQVSQVQQQQECLLESEVDQIQEMPQILDIPEMPEMSEMSEMSEIPPLPELPLLSQEISDLPSTSTDTPTHSLDFSTIPNDKLSSSPPFSPLFDDPQSTNVFEDNLLSSSLNAIAHSSTSTESTIGVNITRRRDHDQVNFDAIDKVVETLVDVPIIEPILLPSNAMKLTSTTAPLTHAKNPVNVAEGRVMAAFVASTDNFNEIVVIIQDLTISFWKMSPKIYNVFGVPRACILVGKVERSLTDSEVDVPYQNRIVVGDDKLPVYVEFRGREIPKNGRSCSLTSLYANTYFISESDELTFRSVQLDTIKSSIDSIQYTAITNTMSMAMAWTEQLNKGKRRTAVCKYSLRRPDIESLHSITEFAAGAQDSVQSLTCFADTKLAALGLTTFSMWDHRTGDLLMKLDLDVPLGRNLGCFMLENVDYIFLIQFLKKTGDSDEPYLLKLLAISTDSVNANWRTLQQHTIPRHFNEIISTFISAENLTATFSNGNTLIMNLESPQYLYICDKYSNTKLGNGESSSSSSHGENSYTNIDQNDHSNYQVFVRNGQILQISKDYLLTRSVCEYFISYNK